MLNQKIKNNKGFTLVEVIIAAGLIAGLSLVMMNIFKQQNFTQKKTESSFELSTIQQSINQTLLNEKACINTFAAVGDIRSATSLPRIRSSTGAILYQVGNTYNNLVRITAIDIKNVVINPNPVPAGTRGNGDLEIDVKFQRTSKILANLGNTSSTWNYKIRVEVNSAHVVTSCYSALQSAIDTSKRLTCESIGGVFDTVADKCNLMNYPAALQRYNAVSTKFLDDYRINYLDPRFVNTTGDTMTGALIMNAAPINVSNASVNLNNSDLVMTNASDIFLTNGNFTQTGGFITTNQYVSVSDKRLKHKITALKNQSKKIYDVKNYEFFWNTDNRKDYGFIAQEIERIFPELVVTNPDTGYKGVQYVSMIPLMLEELKTLKKENDKLKRENANLKKDIDKIKMHLNLN